MSSGRKRPKKAPKQLRSRKTAKKISKKKVIRKKAAPVRKISSRVTPKKTIASKKSVSKRNSYTLDPADLHVTPFQILKQNGSTIGKVPTLKPAQIQEMYRFMVLARVFDDRALKLQRQGRMGTYASVLGQEAVQVGSAYALHKDDWLVPTFRQNASCLVHGMPMKALYQYWGGDERGHAFEESKTMMPISIPISTQVPHAVGIGMAFTYRKEKKAVLVHMGDGGTSEGDFHEGLNFAGVFQAPVVFLTTNNYWAISVPREKQTHAQTLAQKALAYGFTGVIVDGNDMFAMYQAVSDALEKAKSGGGPTLIEAVTYRMGDHTTADEAKRYRNPKEVAAWAKKDPIQRIKNYMMKKKMWSAAKEKALLEEVTAAVAKAVKEYEEDSLPNPKDMFVHTFAEMPVHLDEQQKDLVEVAGKHADPKILEKIEGGFP